MHALLGLDRWGRPPALPDVQGTGLGPAPPLNRVQAAIPDYLGATLLLPCRSGSRPIDDMLRQLKRCNRLTRFFQIKRLVFDVEIELIALFRNKTIPLRFFLGRE